MEFGGGRTPRFYSELGVFCCKGYMEASLLLGIFFSQLGEIKGCSWRPASSLGGSSSS
jgi:hypothetical protein